MPSLHSYDLAFWGFGASAILMLHHLHKEGKLEGKKMWVGDPNPEAIKGKTYCFWAGDNEPIVQDLNSLISKSWSKIAIDQLPSEDIDPYKYRYIDGVDMYNYGQELLELHNISIQTEAVLSFDDEGDLVRFPTSKGDVISRTVFDSRPPEWNKREHDVHLLQSFLGLNVRLKQAKFDPEVYHMMDFRVYQGEGTQFIYTLPQDEETALIEYTRFGRQAIDRTSTRVALKKWIEERYGAVEYGEEETGVIPMFSSKAKKIGGDNIIPLGTRADKVKPTTGYAFDRMYHDARSWVRSNTRASSSKRFELYDRWLLDILDREPERGKSIFLQLFAKNRNAFVLKFLRERSKLVEELRMFSTLPIGLFLQAAMRDVRRSVHSTSWASLIFILLYVIALQFTSTEIVRYASWSVLGLGMLWRGIPHGALDAHYLRRTGERIVPFILRYVAIMAMVGVLWWWLPGLSLMLFILISMWHFGQTDLREWRMDHPMANLLWGLALFAILLGFHPQETTGIISFWIEGWMLPTWIGWTGVGLGLATAMIFRVRQAVWWTIILGFTAFTDLITAFLIYFILRHSLVGWSHLRLQTAQTSARLFKQALAYTLGALVVILALLLTVDRSNQAFIPMAFVGLSLVSTPHVIFMSRWYREVRG